jgi:transcriptional regulator NrdR family protein
MHEDKDIPVKRRKRQCVECKAIYYTIEMKSGTARWLAASAKETGLTRTPLASKKEQE